MDKAGILEGKNVLFFTWPFYQYPEKIEKQLADMGANVTTFLSASTSNFLKLRFLERFEFLKKSYFDEILSKIHGDTYDYVFMINAAIFPEYFLRELSIECQTAIKILYSWDSVEVYPNVIKMHKYFDYIYSFDSNDVKKYPYMKFLPLFFCEDLCTCNKKQSEEYDFSFIGFGHTDRYRFISSIREFAEKKGYRYNFKLYLPSKLHYIRGKYYKKLFPDAKVGDFVYMPISMEETREIINSSRIVVDMELGTQSGLTMRTIETHGMRKKLITTNANIKEYDFYNPNNILIVDRANPVIPDEFVHTPYKELDRELYDKYSLKKWLETIFKGDKDD